MGFIVILPGVCWRVLQGAGGPLEGFLWGNLVDLFGALFISQFWIHWAGSLSGTLIGVIWVQLNLQM